MTTPMPERDRPDYRSAFLKKQDDDVALIRDVAGGYAAVKAKSTTYLPQHPKEERKNYTIRLNRPTFFNAFARTVEGLVGMVFRVDPALGDDVPAPMREHWEDIDKEGNHGDVFLKALLSDALEGGHCAILVDFPRVSAGRPLTLAQERALDVRPYWVHIRKEDIVNLRSSRGPGGERILDQITLRFTTHEAQGAFGDREVVRYRVYRRVQDTVTWETWEVPDGRPEPVFIESGTIAVLNRIPIVPVYAKQTGYFTSTPPLLDLAQINLLHYQTNSDYFHAMHIGLVPIFVITGGPEGTVELGPNAYLSLPQGATAQYTETAGTAFGAARTALEDLEGQMAVMGLSLLQAEKRAAETAEAKRLDKSEKDSALTRAARALQDAVESALGFHAQYLTLPDGGSLTVNTDFMGEALSPDMVARLSDTVARGQLSLETMWQKLKEGEWLPDDFDPDLERSRLEAEGMVTEPKEESEPA